ncbi:helix-turn-helix domain-containing protein [Enterococcus cecorum]|uniref:helix-turn-helix domain-containing protein n=1 Tax=Enterococcus cecorum TaxID=44008 RepID=UPI00200A1553|nr:helix-turn-helix transcriptional regulator [Enterococcus cecorum]
MWRKVQKELEKQNMTIYRLTKLTGVSRSVMYEFKNGKIKKPSFELMEKIADALNVSMDVFRKDEE